MTTTAKQTRPTASRSKSAGEPMSAELESPLEASERAPRGGANLYGSFSIENFCGQGSLSLTHEDADGFLAYPSQFNAPNFRYRDGGVKVWAYYETYDNWQDTYGMDAVRAPYHSGHGGMDANGVFYAPMGAAWAGNDCTATSTNMRLGNEHARYLFWSTCESLRVLGGHSPIRTWSAANQGLRMIFGFETTSWDDARYGSGFWNHWRRGESLSTAWLNSSWDIAHDQAPSVSACGASAQEAQDRLFNERFLSGAQANTTWYWWRWYNTAASAAREVSRSVPQDPRIAMLTPTDARSLADIGQRFGVDSMSALRRGGIASMGDGERRVSVGDDGIVTARLARPNRENRTPLARREALAVAEGAIRSHGLDGDASMVLDQVIELREGGGSDTGDGQMEGPFTTGTMVQYRQLVNGLPLITPSAGCVRVTIDNDGTITDIHSSTRGIEDLSDRPRSTTMEPPPPGSASHNGGISPDTALAQAFSRQLRDIVAHGPAPVGYSTVPGTTEVGYDVRGSEAVIIARQAVEIEFDGGYKKRYWVKAPLFA
jgi:hypothetical protein